MLKTILAALISLFLVSNNSDTSLARLQQEGSDTQSGTLEKMIVANGSVALDLDLKRLNGSRSRSQANTLRFDVAPNSFFTILVFNGDLRALEPGSISLKPQGDANLPAALAASYQQLMIESTAWGGSFELVVRDEKTGFVFFNIEGHQFDYAPNEHTLGISKGRLLLSKEFAKLLGRSSEAGSEVGTISVTANMRPIEITQVLNGQATSSVMPPLEPSAGTVPGPDVIVGDLSGLAQFGSSSGTQVGLAVGTDSCNAGVVPLNWLALPNNDHPVIPQNLYRMSGGATNDQRFEQIGQSSVKHAFTALQQNICGFGCNATASTTLGSGCSDPYTASLNAGNNNALGSRAWINPFTGAYPGGSSPGPNSHTGHTHTGPSHRILVEMSDLNTTLNPGATYYTEAQYVTPHEYAWCIAHPGECNMNNNASYRQYTVSGTTSFSFSPVGSTVRMKPAVTAWVGASIKEFQPDPGNDGIGYVGSKVTNPSPGVWHYEYVLYNENMDRAIQSFSVPLGPGITLSNVGFHAPPQHPAWANDGTVGNAGYSSAPWATTQTASSMTWNSETFAQNPNANAIRWGTLYNFRFDSDRPPQSVSATVGFFKTGAPIVLTVQAPTPAATLPALSINDVSVTEGNAGTISANFNVTLSASSTDTVTVQYATANNSATAGSDYVSAGGTVTFTPGQVSQPVSITVNGDTLEEFNETFFVNLTSPVNATISDSQGVGTINNDETPLAGLLSGFSETQINGLTNPTAMAIHPDGRVFVCQQSGALRVIKNGALLGTPFTTLSVNSSGERGLLGVAFDPNYATNHFIYVYYTATSPAIHNRVSRFTADIANEDVAVVGSESVLLDLNNLSGATNHNGGAIHFGPDGKLYVAVGENANSSNSQNLTNLLGKMLRLNPNPADPIPADNPTTFPGIAGSPSGNNRAIWAVGLRNPFTFSFQQGTGRMHINDVGEGTWEEVNLGVAGANYGWGAGCEGACGVAGMTNPVYQYSSAGSPECAITGGAFYNPTTPTFPAEYIGKYFLADFCGGWIKSLDPLNPPATGAATGFATGISSPVDIQVANDGSLYYLARGSGSVFRVQYFGGSTLAINDVSITEGNAGTSVANFTVFLSPASSQTVTVQYATANNTALFGIDYLAASGTLTFTPGQQSQPVSVTINGDTSVEPNETFNVNLSSATNATIGDSQGVGTILNDDVTQPAISIGDVALTEGNSGTTTATFTVSIPSTSSQNVTVDYATAGDTATSGTDFVAASGTATITAGQLSTTVNVTVNGDITVEPNETFFVNLTNPTNATIGDNQATGTINNDDTDVTVVVSPSSVTEDGATNLVYTFTRTGVTSGGLGINFSVAGTATVDTDYTPSGASIFLSSSGTFVMGAGVTTVMVTVNPITDTRFEAGETVILGVNGGTGYNIGSPSVATGTITNDDPQPTISIDDVTRSEANFDTVYNFTVSLSNPSDQNITVDYATANGSATEPSDYTAVPTTQLTFNAGETTRFVTVFVHGDSVYELDETFFVNLTNPTNATTTDQGIGTITNDDAQPTISIDDVTHNEGDAGTTDYDFTVSLSGLSSQTITVTAASADNTALTADGDYTGMAGALLTFAPNTTTQHFHVLVNGDTKFEVNEQFLVNLSGAANSTIADGQGVGAITNDDAEPTISIDDVTHNEGNAGTTDYDFTVSLSNASYLSVTVNAATADSTATTADSDYTSVPSTPLTFSANTTTPQHFHVLVNGDSKFELNEAFVVNLTGATNATVVAQGFATITNDDTEPSISIDDVTHNEGDSGTTDYDFTVSLSNLSVQTITVNVASADNTALTGDADYTGIASTPLTFAPNTTTQHFHVLVNGDTALEPNEIFNVNLSGATNATIADNQGSGTIINDDSQPTISIDDVSLSEGNTGATSAAFTVSLSSLSSQTITVNYATADDTATAGNDYVSAGGTLTFTPGQASQPLNVTVNTDLLNEESPLKFKVSLSAATNATIADNQGVGTIMDDDAPILATELNSQRAIALDAITFVRDPFAVTNLNYFGADKRTRLTLFATNLSLTPGLVVTAQAVDSQQMTHSLPVEFVGSMPTFLGSTQIVVKLPDGIVNAGDLQVSITVRGRTSNSVLVGVTP